MENDPNTPIVLRQARWKLSLGAVGCIAFVALGAVFVRSPESFDGPKWEMAVIGWVSVVFFGACAVAIGAGLWRPVSVSLGPDGVEMTSAFRTWRRS